MRMGIKEVRELINKRRKVMELVEGYKTEGISYKPPTLEDLLRDRE